MPLLPVSSSTLDCSLTPPTAGTTVDHCVYCGGMKGCICHEEFNEITLQNFFVLCMWTYLYCALCPIMIYNSFSVS